MVKGLFWLFNFFAQFRGGLAGHILLVHIYTECMYIVWSVMTVGLASWLTNWLSAHATHYFWAILQSAVVLSNEQTSSCSALLGNSSRVLCCRNMKLSTCLEIRTAYCYGSCLGRVTEVLSSTLISCTRMEHAGIGPTHVNNFLSSLNVPPVSEWMLRNREEEIWPAIEQLT